MMKKTHTNKMIPVAPIVNSTLHTGAETSKAEVIMALNTLDNIYKNNIRSYADTIHECTHQMDDTRNHLEILYKEIKPHKITLLETQKEIDYEIRTLEHFTQEWNQITLVIQALQKELAQLKHSEKEQEHVLKSRNASLKKLKKDIENTELRLLEHALQKQNIVILIKPTEREITALELRMKQLESQKRYIESSYLHHISPSGQSEKPRLLDNPSDSIDL